MLRRSVILAAYSGHTAPTVPKYLDKPGLWGVEAGPTRDTLQRRIAFYRHAALAKIGRFTGMFKTKQTVWLWRRFQVRAWKTSVFTLVGLIFLLLGNIWIVLVYHAYAVGPATPVLERKVREHRVSKQIMQMVRERERDILEAKEKNELDAVVEQHKANEAAVTAKE